MAALTEASARDCSNASEFVRRATLERLRAMGFELSGSLGVRGRPPASASAE
jgi:hypothetical protein